MQHPAASGVEVGATGGGGGRSLDPWSVLRRVTVLLALLLLLPVPWQHQTDSTLGLVWKLDGRLVVEGERLDPPGRWSWLTVGRPPLVGEVAWDRAARLVDPEAPTTTQDLRVGPAEHRPVHVEPIAAAAGLDAAGLADRLPDGELAPADAVLGGHGPPFSWVRELAVGSSHGLMVGLTTYVAASGEDLAAGRHVAGTGTLDADGAVGMIGALPAKAQGAHRRGVDVLLVPAAQADQLERLDLGDMQVLAVATLDDAIAQLRATR